MCCEVERKTVFGSSLHKNMLVPVFSVSTIGTYLSLKTFCQTDKVTSGYSVLRRKGKVYLYHLVLTKKQIFVFQSARH